MAYVSEQNLLIDDDRSPVRHPQLEDMFSRNEDGDYIANSLVQH